GGFEGRPGRERGRHQDNSAPGLNDPSEVAPVWGGPPFGPSWPQTLPLDTTPCGSAALHGAGLRATNSPLPIGTTTDRHPGAARTAARRSFISEACETALSATSRPRGASAC